MSINMIELFFKYYTLVSNYLDNKIDASEFEKLYMDMYLKEDVGDLYEILNDLFCDVEAYCSIPGVPLDAFNISEEEMRAGCVKALSRLDEYRKLNNI